MSSFPLVLTVVLIGMAKARGKRVAAEQHSARMRMIAEKPVHEMRLRQEAERLEQISAYQSQWDAPGIEATVVGGSGYGFAQHHRVLLGMKHSTIYLLSPSDAQLTTIASQDINELDVSPGHRAHGCGYCGRRLWSGGLCQRGSCRRIDQCSHHARLYQHLCQNFDRARRNLLAHQRH